MRFLLVANYNPARCFPLNGGSYIVQQLLHNFERAVMIERQMLRSPSAEEKRQE